MNKRPGLSVSAAILFSIALLPACGQSTAVQEAQVYRVPQSMASVAALAGRLSSMTPGRVGRIVDGDTIVVSFDPGTGLGRKEKVRLIGVDTPETVDPRRPVERFGAEASRFAKERLLGRSVRLAFEPELRDYFGRLLAYVFLEDGSCFNLTIVAEGYGFAYTKYPFSFMDDFRAAERKARAGKRGLWG
ncbi:MAG: nuclease [Spirochaetae bacterium HGW-Spirochaetae-7]|jgi:micrococcal nuclease|nr:MAG: nuclease [Spirochaetae bacterium HGW-Spirochaetae-7]